MAVDILGETRAARASADPSPDMHKLLCYGDLPQLARIPFKPTPGTWAVQVSSQGPYIVTLGVVAQGFKTAKDAEAWRETVPRELRSRYIVSLLYTPTEDDLARLHGAPKILHVPCLLVDAISVLDDGAVGRQWREAWASLAEARHRVEALKAQGTSAKISEIGIRFFHLDVQDMLERDSHIQKINGNTSGLRDGTAWWSDEFAGERANYEDWRPGHLPDPYSLTIYRKAQVRKITGVVHSDRAVYAQPVDLGEFPDRDAAQLAGWQALASDGEAFAFGTCALNIPDTMPPLCYVARADRSGKRIASTRLTAFFKGPSRYEEARDVCDLLKDQWPDAAVFYTKSARSACKPILRASSSVAC
jgi:hypothetical protein